jgi:hypothetical protein
MWRVQRGHARVLLFGDGPPRENPVRFEKVDRAVRASTLLWKEVPPIPTAIGTKIVGARGMERSAPLTRRFPSDADRIRRAAEGAGLPMSLVEGFKPWAAALLIQGGYWPRQGLKNELNDAGAADTAKALGLPIRYEMDSPEAALGYFAGMPDAAQADFLRWVLSDIDAGKQGWLDRAIAWEQGDLRREEQVVATMARDYPHLYAAHVVARNRAWTPRVLAALDAGQGAFIVVGADHLVGPDRLQGQLEAAGLRVKRI